MTKQALLSLTDFLVKPISTLFFIVSTLAFVSCSWANSQTYIDTDYFNSENFQRLKKPTPPPISNRLPLEPQVVNLVETGKTSGKHGGQLRMLMGRTKDIRMMMVYGYSRLVGYDETLAFKADILKSFDVQEGRIFTFHLRKGHKWSDGAPFTSEDFKYFWEDVLNNDELYPFGVPKALLVNDEPPIVEFPDDTTVRYSWQKPNPFFLPAIAGPRPLFLYAPKHYSKQFHISYANEEKLAALVEETGVRNWAGLHHRHNHPYKNDNPKLPMLQPWVNTTRPPSERFVFTRNPYYYRVDEAGHQLPYIDEVIIQITSKSLVAAKTGAGESDLQGRYIRLDNYTFLKGGEQRNDFSVRLWSNGTGAQLAIYPNLNSNNPIWRKLVRNTNFRRALSISINRREINQVIYFGLALESNNTVLPQCSLFKPEYQTAWAHYDIDQANKMLDALGLTDRDDRGIRLMENGEPVEIILQTAGESTEETDILELVGESWKKVGIKLHTKPSQREVFRERVFSGEAMMAMFNGIDNGTPTANMSPESFAPTHQNQLQWPKWGQYAESNGGVGEAPDIPEGQRLMELYHQWSESSRLDERTEIWHEILDINAQQVFSIGLICGVPQPIVVNNKLKNVPETASFGWEPTAYFGVYKPDTFWFENQE
ncbi:MAG: ABC transporter substrate-binding protein [Gammaproteobacteria bacterium]|nr:ABC transporter substrate-binding protein [Gammaproteobacteria bacterium]